jgi:hypothetical protein
MLLVEDERFSGDIVNPPFPFYLNNNESSI